MANEAHFFFKGKEINTVLEAAGHLFSKLYFLLVTASLYNRSKPPTISTHLSLLVTARPPPSFLTDFPTELYVSVSHFFTSGMVMSFFIFWPLVLPIFLASQMPIANCLKMYFFLYPPLQFPYINIFSSLNLGIYSLHTCLN